MAGRSSILPVLFALIVMTVMLAGCGMMFFYFKDKLPAAASRLGPRPTDLKVASFDEIQARERPLGLTDRQRQSLDALVDLLISTSGSDPDGIKQTQALIQAAERNPRKVSRHASYLTNRITKEVPKSEARKYATAYLIMEGYSSSHVNQAFATRLAEFACDYPDSQIPILIYRRVVDDLVNQGKGHLALQLLEHGVNNCEGYRDVTSLAKFRTMTLHTVSLLNRGRGHNSAQHSLLDTSLGKNVKHASSKRGGKFDALLGKPMEIRGRGLDGRAVSTPRNSWVVVHFWATWCNACRKGIPDYVELESSYASRGVQFISVSLDTDEDALRKFVESAEITWPQVVSQEQGGWETELASQYGIKSIPVSFLLGPDGTVVEAGIRNAREMESCLQQHLP